MLRQGGILGVDELTESARRLEQVTVLCQRQQLQPDGTTGLVAAQHISLASLCEIEIGQLEPVERGGHRGEALTGAGPGRHPSVEQAEAGVSAATDAATQLMQL